MIAKIPNRYVFLIDSYDKWSVGFIRWPNCFLYFLPGDTGNGDVMSYDYNLEPIHDVKYGKSDKY